MMTTTTVFAFFGILFLLLWLLFQFRGRVTVRGIIHTTFGYRLIGGIPWALVFTLVFGLPLWGIWALVLILMGQ